MTLKNHWKIITQSKVTAFFATDVKKMNIIKFTDFRGLLKQGFKHWAITFVLLIETR